MVGGGSRKDNGLSAISSTNIFAALESRRRKKRLDRSASEGKASKEPQNREVIENPSQFWATSFASVKSWADVEDDDDYYATTAPPPPAWAVEQPPETLEHHKESSSTGEESEGEEDVEDVVDDVEEEANDEAADTVPKELISPFSTAPPTPAVREPAKQLSKKELKKKELADLDAVLQELGLSKAEDGNDGLDEKKLEADADENGHTEAKGDNSTLTESKSSKRRKAKKEKSFKEGKDVEIAYPADVETETKGEDNGPENGEVSIASADPKEILKKLASLKKKKSMKDSDTGAKAAASEAAVRSAKLAAAKKKEKNHYNQHPVR